MLMRLNASNSCDRYLYEQDVVVRMKVVLYGLKACDTCKKAVKSLQNTGHDVVYIDVRKDGVSVDDLSKFQDIFGEALVNKRSTTWRNLSEQARSGPVLPLLAAHPTLMKRPVIDAHGALTLGWGKDVQQKFESTKGG